ncbi:MAG TPA: YqiA/YcfP family alpha/beta fold hydrolase [Vicinamibacterales bacterium]
MTGLPRTARCLYLHGFASSAQSTKAGYLGERLRESGVMLECPDFNEPDFSTLTMSRMLAQLERTLRERNDRATVIGSSLGGTLAVLAAERLPDRIDRLVLMAPAVMFAKAGHHLLPPERIASWRERGSLPFFHYGFNEERALNFSFYEDSLGFDAFNASFAQPTLIFQGMRDASVDYRTVEAFAASRPNVTLSLLDDDHQLIASLPRMWNDLQVFLGLVD